MQRCRSMYEYSKREGDRGRGKQRGTSTGGRSPVGCTSSEEPDSQHAKADTLETTLNVHRLGPLDIGMAFSTLTALQGYKHHERVSQMGRHASSSGAIHVHSAPTSETLSLSRKTAYTASEKKSLISAHCSPSTEAFGSVKLPPFYVKGKPTHSNLDVM